MKKKYTFGAIVIAILTIIAIWQFTSPERAVAEMEAAVRTGDEVVIEGLIDFPSVRKSYVQFATDLAFEEDGFQEFLAANPEKASLFKTWLEQTAESKVTPQAIADGLREAEASTHPDDSPKLSEGWAIRKDGFFRFTATHPNADFPIQLNFERSGLKWQIIGFKVIGFDRERLENELRQTFEETG